MSIFSKFKTIQKQKTQTKMWLLKSLKKLKIIEHSPHRKQNPHKNQLYSVLKDVPNSLNFEATPLLHLRGQNMHTTAR